jgi:hypothetical protein
MIDQVRQPKIFHLRFQVGHAVLQRTAIDEHLRDEGALADIKGRRWDLISDLTGHGQRPRPSDRVGKLSEPLADGQEILNPGRNLGYTRFDKMAETLGCYGEYVERPDEIRPALDRAQREVDRGSVALVNVKTDDRARATTVTFAQYAT